MRVAGMFRYGDQTMRTFETAASAMLAIAAQALVIGVVVTTF